MGLISKKQSRATVGYETNNELIPTLSFAICLFATTLGGKPADTKTKSLFWQVGFWRFFGYCLCCSHNMLIIWDKIDAPLVPFCNNGHQLCTHSACFTLVTYMVKRYSSAASNTFYSLPIDSTNLRLTFSTRYGKMNSRRSRCMIYLWLNPCLFAFFLRKPPLIRQWHLPSPSRVRALHCTHPQPGDHRPCSSTIVIWQRHLRIQVPNTPFYLITHPLAIIATIVGEPSCTVPVTVFPGFACDRSLSGKLWWQFD